MIRPTTLLWMGLAGAVGFGLFQLKHEVQALEDDLFRLNRQILAEQQQIHVLKAEWSYINQPERLEALARRHLDLAPMRPQQIGSVADLPARHAGDAAATLPVAAPRPVVSPPTGPAASSAPRPPAAPPPRAGGDVRSVAHVPSPPRPTELTGAR